MAYCKVMASHHASAALRYGEHEKSAIKGEVNCPGDTKTAVKLFKADRVMWQKDSGIEAHIIIQSFKGQEISPEKANRLGCEMVQKMFPNHRARVYTHTESDGKNVHNHIVISAVNLENGKKIDTHGLLQKARVASDELCRAHELSIIDGKHPPELRYTLAERGLQDRGHISWRDMIRDAVDDCRARSRTFDEFTQRMKDEKNITVKDNGENRKYRLTYIDAEGRKARGAKLGANYEKEGIEHELEKQRSYERTRTATLGRAGATRQNGRTSGFDREAEEADKRITAIREQRIAAARERQAAEAAARAAEAQRREIASRKRALQATRSRNETGIEYSR